MDRLVSILLLKGKFPSNKTSEDPDQSKTHILEYFTCPQSNFISTLKKTRLWYILAVNFDNIQTLNRYRQIVDRNKNHPYKPRKTEGPWLLFITTCKSSIWFTKKHIFKIIIYFFNTSKCAENYVISFEVYYGQKILKLWRQETWPFGPGWSATITIIRSWTFRLPCYKLDKNS